jgi:fibronectin-binding autotransporter adhesin
MKSKFLLPQSRIFATAAVTICACVNAYAAPKTWVGNSTTDWVTAANWSPSGAVTGDSFIFGAAGSSGTALTNTLTAGFSVAGITFNSGASTYTMGGNAITLTTGITNNSTSLQTLNHAITLSGTNTITTTTGGGNVTLGGNLGGTGALTKAGAGTLTLGGTNNYSGLTSVTGGKLAIASGGSVASSANSASIVNGGGTLEISGTLTLTGSHSLYAASAAGGGTIDIKAGGIVNAGGTGVSIGQNFASSNGILDVSGTYSQTTGFIFIGNQASSATGTVNVKSGGLVTFGAGMANSSASGATNATGVVLGRNGAIGTINLETNGTLESAKNIIRGDGTGNFNFNGGTLKVITTTGTSLDVTTTTVNSGGAIVDTNGLNFTITDAMVAGTGTGGLTKKSSGTLTISGANTFAGATDIQGGTLKLASGSTIANTSSITVGSGATLDLSAATSLTLGSAQTIQGVGSVTGGTVITGANTSTIAPGTSPGTLTLAALNAANGGTFDFELGTTSDLLAITGALTGSTNAGDLNFNFSDAGGLLAGTTYTLFTFGSESGFTESDLDAIAIPNGWTLDSSFDGNGWKINANSLQVQFIPEPASALLGGLGLLALLRRRRA